MWATGLKIASRTASVNPPTRTSIDSWEVRLAQTARRIIPWYRSCRAGGMRARCSGNEARAVRPSCSARRSKRPRGFRLAGLLSFRALMSGRACVFFGLERLGEDLPRLVHVDMRPDEGADRVPHVRVFVLAVLRPRLRQIVQGDHTVE